MLGKFMEPSAFKKVDDVLILLIWSLETALFKLCKLPT